VSTPLCVQEPGFVCLCSLLFFFHCAKVRRSFCFHFASVEKVEKLLAEGHVCANDSVMRRFNQHMAEACAKLRATVCIFN
jgi:hypothetical protein